MDLESISCDGSEKSARAMSTYYLDLMLKMSSLLTGMIEVSSKLCLEDPFCAAFEGMCRLHFLLRRFLAS